MNSEEILRKTKRIKKQRPQKELKESKGHQQELKGAEIKSNGVKRASKGITVKNDFIGNQDETMSKVIDRDQRNSKGNQ